MKLYGSLNNRLEENRMFVDEIEVGTGVTEYLWSDCHPFEVTAVINQKDVFIRPMKHERPNDNGDYAYTNEWVITSDETAQAFEIVKRGNYWYRKVTVTPDEVKAIMESNDIDARLWLCHNGFHGDEIIASGKAKTKYHRMNVSFGKAEYYYDYEF